MATVTAAKARRVERPDVSSGGANQGIQETQTRGVVRQGPTIAGSDEELLEIRVAIERLAARMRSDLRSLRAYGEQEDLVQEVMTKALERLDQFQGRSQLKTWVISLARNHLLGKARGAKIRPRTVGSDAELDRRAKDDPEKTAIQRESTRVLLQWLKDNPHRVRHGHEVMNLLLHHDGNFDFVAYAMTLKTREPWTVEAVRTVVRRIRNTGRGSSLCEAVGLL